MDEVVMYGSDSRPIRTRIKMYQAVEAERSRPGCLFRWALWLCLPVQPPMRPERVLQLLWTTGYVWSENYNPAEPEMTLDDFMDPYG